MEADLVIGQENFTSIINGTARNRLSGGIFGNVYSNGKIIIVADSGNNRVLIFNKFPTSNFASADVVIGATSLDSAGAGGCTRTTLLGPQAVYYDGQRLYIADDDNDRILIYNSLPTTNGAPADVVLGQPNFTTCTDGVTTQSSLNSPSSVFANGNQLFVGDDANNRVMVWNKIPTQNGTPADFVLGQPDFVTASGGVGSNKFNTPEVCSDGIRFFVGDFFNARVLIYNRIPTSSNVTPDVVIGQADFNSNTTGLSDTKFNSTGFCHSDGVRLFFTDFLAARVLVYNSIPKTNLASADFVLGQRDFNSAVSQASRAGITGAGGVFSDGKHLFVTDLGGRVLIYNIGNTKPELSPQFTQGKAVLGKVFHDINENGTQDQDEKGLEGIKIASDTGIYAITDEDGKYHYPFIETGQHVLKIDESSLPRGSKVTSENPRHITVTEGVLTKVSFGVQLLGEDKPLKTTEPLLKVSISEDPTKLKPNLQVQATQKDSKLLFNITCNYYLFIQKAELILYTKDLEVLKTISLPNPLPLYYEIPLEDLPQDQNILYQLKVYDQEGHEDRTGVGEIRIS